MKSISLTFPELEIWTEQYQGDRTGVFYEDGELHFPDSLEAQILAVTGALSQSAALVTIKSRLIAEVNTAAEAERQRHITPGEGQAMTYTEKLAQARAFLAAETPDAASYPMISNEVGITAATAEGVAQTIITAYTTWAAIGAAIEKVRMETNSAIAEAADKEAACAARSDIVWPTAN